MSYIVDKTIRNLDEHAYRRLKAHAALHDLTVGEAINQAIEVYLSQAIKFEKTGSFADLPSADFGPGNEDLSERVDEILYGE